MREMSDLRIPSSRISSLDHVVNLVSRHFSAHSCLKLVFSQSFSKIGVEPRENLGLQMKWLTSNYNANFPFPEQDKFKGFFIKISTKHFQPSRFLICLITFVFPRHPMYMHIEYRGIRHTAIIISQYAQDQTSFGKYIYWGLMDKSWWIICSEWYDDTAVWQSLNTLYIILNRIWNEMRNEMSHNLNGASLKA